MNAQIFNTLLENPEDFRRFLNSQTLGHPENYGLGAYEDDWPKVREWLNARPIKFVESEIRYEGCDPYRFEVYAVTLADGAVVYFQESRWYSSQGDHGEITYQRVTPKEKVVTVWEPL